MNENENEHVNANGDEPVITFISLLGRDNLWYEENYLSKEFKAINKQIDETVKQKLVEKGFGHLIKDMRKKRFPKICCISFKKWNYFFADDDSEKGVFLIAIENYDLKSDLKNYGGLQLPVVLNCKQTYNGEVDFKHTL